MFGRVFSLLEGVQSQTVVARAAWVDKNSSGDEIANVNFFYDDIVHVEASACAH